MPKEQKLVNNIKRQEWKKRLANCIALHDFNIATPDLRKWLAYTSDFMQEQGLIPNRMSSPTPNSRKNISYKIAVTKLDKIYNFDVENIWFAAVAPNHNSDMFDNICHAGIDLEKHCTTVTLSIDNQVFGFDYQLWNKIALELARITGAQYGYIYQRLFMHELGYPYGVISNLEYGDPERKYISKWSKVYGAPSGNYQTGDLRDIYPINILCKKHLERVVFGQSFKEWINASSEHGILEKLNSNIWSWQLQAEQIPIVREKLRSTGMVLCI